MLRYRVPLQQGPRGAWAHVHGEVALRARALRRAEGPDHHERRAVAEAQRQHAVAQCLADLLRTGGATARRMVRRRGATDSELSVQE